VVAQRFAQNGSSLGSTFFVNPVTIRTPILQQRQPTLAAAPAGGFVIAWTQLFTYIGPPERALRQGDPNSPGIVARCFDRLGRPLGPVFRVDTLDGDGDDAPSVAVTPSGHIVFTWNLGGEVVARIFCEPGFAPRANAGSPAWPSALVVALGILAASTMGFEIRRRPAKARSSRSPDG
jgi:hypothetical protein